MNDDEIPVPVGDKRPVWYVAREWYLRLAAELDLIVAEGGVRTPRGLYAVSPKGIRTAAKRAAFYRKTAEILTREQPAFERVPEAA